MTLVDSYTYEPYGGIQSQTQSVAQPFKWIGAVYDSATGLYYIAHRYYDPNFDRWTQMDPSGLASVNLANPQTLSQYTYAIENPVNYIDPTGLRWSWKAFAQSTVGGAVGGAIGGAFAGSVALPLIGSVPGYVAGGILGGIGGAAVYAVTGWW